MSMFLNPGLNNRSLQLHLNGSAGKESICNAGDTSAISGLGRSPREENGNPLQYSCLKDPMVGEAWWATVKKDAKSRM